MHKTGLNEGRLSEALRWAVVVVCALLLGVLIGFYIMLIFDAAYWVINGIWIAGWTAVGTQLFPLIICTTAGLLLALITLRYGKPVRPIEAAQTIEVGAEEDGANKGYSANSPHPINAQKRPLFIRLADFFLPFAGGGPVGVAMGLIGFIISGSKWIKHQLIVLCSSIGLMNRNSEPTKRQKTVLYLSAIIGGILGLSIVVEFFGVGMIIPRIDGSSFSLESLLWAALLALAGWALGATYLLFSKLARSLWVKAGRKQPLLPLACGIVLGFSMTVMPHAGLPGSDAYSYQLLEEWTQIDPALLVVTAIVRIVLVAFLLNMGWPGGPFLPLVYCAICLGLGVAGASGLESGLCVAAIVAGILVSFSGQPFMGIAALMCCPPESILVIIVASAIAALISNPKGIKGDFSGGFGRKKSTNSARKEPDGVHIG